MSDNDNGSKQLEYAMLRYELARDKILNAIEGLKRELELKRRLEDDPNKYPQIERVESRIKSESSIKAKCQKKSIEPTIDNIEQYIHDIVGIRIVTVFRHEIYQIVDALLATPGINLVKVKDYIESPKESGYRGYHLIVSVEVYSRGRSSIVTGEIQIRDLLMDAWSKIEHRKRYKPHDDLSESLDASFTKHADILDRFDLEVDNSETLLNSFGISDPNLPCVAAFQGVVVVSDEEPDYDSDADTEFGSGVNKIPEAD